MEKLIEALQTIKEECMKHEECIYCPMYGNPKEFCKIHEDNPCDWEINLKTTKVLGD